MSSLKEIKERIGSVTSTMKITGAMKMVASAKLHHAQTQIEGIRPYEQQLNDMLLRLLASGAEIDSAYTQSHKGGKTAVVVCSSNSGLCGAFNSNIEKELLRHIASLPKDGLMLFPVGKKVREFLVKNHYPVEGDYDVLSGKPSYDGAAALASRLMELYVSREIKQVDLLYYHFRNMMVQVLTTETYLPVVPRTLSEEELRKSMNTDYILEPSSGELIALLLPQVLRLKLHTALLDNNASEHGARTMAMQQAADNADDLLQTLTIQYNKSRQQSITNELLDIAGGSIR